MFFEVCLKLGLPRALTASGEPPMPAFGCRFYIDYLAMRVLEKKESEEKTI